LPEVPVLAVGVILIVERTAVVVLAEFAVAAILDVEGEAAAWVPVTEVEVDVVVLLVIILPVPSCAGVAAKSVTMPKNPLKMSASMPS